MPLTGVLYKNIFNNMIDCSLRFQFFMRQAVGMYITWLVADHIVNSKEREPQIILKCVPLF